MQGVAAAHLAGGAAGRGTVRTVLARLHSLAGHVKIATRVKQTNRRRNYMAFHLAGSMKVGGGSGYGHRRYSYRSGPVCCAPLSAAVTSEASKCTCDGRNLESCCIGKIENSPKRAGIATFRAFSSGCWLCETRERSPRGLYGRACGFESHWDVSAAPHPVVNRPLLSGACGASIR